MTIGHILPADDYNAKIKIRREIDNTALYIRKLTLYRNKSRYTMEKYDRKLENKSHTFDRSSKASRQPPVSEILPRYETQYQEDTTISNNSQANVIQLNKFTDF